MCMCMYSVGLDVVLMWLGGASQALLSTVSFSR